MKNKIRVGIDINEIFRAKWLQFDRYYATEFGEEGVPENDPYVHDFFNEYKFEDTIEVTKDLKEPEDMPKDINPLEYRINEKTGEAPADAFLFRGEEKKQLTAREVYNRFMYEDYCFEIHASAPIMYKGMDLDVNNFLLKYMDYADFTLFSVENYFSIPPTQFFLSKMTSRFRNIKFIEKSEEMWENIDVLITTDPTILVRGIPEGKSLIKMTRPYNTKLNESTISAMQLNDLTNMPEFEKLMGFVSIPDIEKLEETNQNEK
jgi:hypothetical protein